MKLTDKQKEKMLLKLAKAGSGAKTKLSDELGCFGSQITLIIDTGKCPKKYSEKLRKWLSNG